MVFPQVEREDLIGPTIALQPTVGRTVVIAASHMVCSFPLTYKLPPHNAGSR
jgi:hypothetical protein